MARILAGQPDGCGHPWATWATAYAGEPAAVYAPCAVEVAGHPLRRAALVAQLGSPDLGKAEVALRVLALNEAGRAAVDATLAAPETPRPLRRTLLLDDWAGRSPLSITEAALRVAIDGTFDLALLAEADALSVENDSPWRVPDALKALALLESPEESALALRVEGELRTRKSFVGRGEPRPAPTAHSPLPAPLDELARAENLAEHLGDEFSAISAWIRAGEAGERLVRAAVSSGPDAVPGPAPASIHRVLRGESASPGVAMLVLSALASNAGVSSGIFRQHDDLQLRVAGSAVRFSPCGARRRVPAASAGVLVPSDEIEGLARQEIAVAMLRDIGRPFAARAERAREFVAGQEQSAVSRAISANPDARPDPLVAGWQAEAGRDEVARTLARSPTHGAAEFVRIKVLLRLGEPVGTHAEAPTECRAAARPWLP